MSIYVQLNQLTTARFGLTEQQNPKVACECVIVSAGEGSNKTFQKKINNIRLQNEASTRMTAFAIILLFYPIS